MYGHCGLRWIWVWQDWVWFNRHACAHAFSPSLNSSVRYICSRLLFVQDSLVWPLGQKHLLHINGLCHISHKLQWIWPAWNLLLGSCDTRRLDKPFKVLHVMTISPGGVLEVAAYPNGVLLFVSALRGLRNKENLFRAERTHSLPWYVIMRYSYKMM